MIHHWLLWLLVVMVTIISLALSAVVEGWLDVEQQKKNKEPMFWCHKHGMFRKIHTLALFPHLGVDANVCPICYKEAVWDNPNKPLKEDHGPGTVPNATNGRA